MNSAERRAALRKEKFAAEGAVPWDRELAQAPDPDGATPRARRGDADERPGTGVASRRVAAEALQRIGDEGAYANLVLPGLLARSGLDERDRGFVTELVYGTTRMRRSCDWLVDRFVLAELDPQARALLRLGAYQLVFLDTPAHAAVSATVDAAPRKLRGLVNAVLRRVADGDRRWPDEATRVSYPDWIIERLTQDLGADDALAALEAMNQPGHVTEREDGYTQDLASQWVADAVGAQAGEVVLDACAAPGGKATRLAAEGATVVAADLRPSRVGLIAGNVAKLGLDHQVFAIAADGLHPPLREATVDRLLIDAPCSGLGALRRRPDARWRITAADVTALAALQIDLVESLLPLVKPGGTFVYSVCTLTAAETRAVDDHLAAAHPDLEPLGPPDVGDTRDTATPADLDEPADADPPPESDRPRWRPAGRGFQVLPQDAGTDGMYLLRFRVP